jgi:hypothetical protein
VDIYEYKGKNEECGHEYRKVLTDGRVGGQTEKNGGGFTLK